MFVTSDYLNFYRLQKEDLSRNAAKKRAPQTLRTDVSFLVKPSRFFLCDFMDDFHRDFADALPTRGSEDSPKEGFKKHRLTARRSQVPLPLSSAGFVGGFWVCVTTNAAVRCFYCR